MPKYMMQLSYTAEGAQGLRKDGGTKRVRVAAKAAESVGATLESMYFSFGSHDVVVMVDAPDAAAIAAVSLAVGASGAARVSTTPLITAEEMDKACGKRTAYKAPGK